MKDSGLDLNWLEVVGDGTTVPLSKEPIEDPGTYDFSELEGMDLPRGPSDTAAAQHAVQVSFEPEKLLTRMISEADAIVGCIAWMTSDEVLGWLAKKQAVSIIVQKEDFLRPDLEPRRGWVTRLRKLYDRIPGGLERSDQTFAYTDLCDRSMLGNPGIDGVRCCGVRRSGEMSIPRMHHKFMVGMKISGAYEPTDSRPLYYPYCVFTGSFNPTKNGRNSLENGVLITKDIDPFSIDYTGVRRNERHPVVDELMTASVPHAFLLEWAHVLALSEPLDWEHEYVAPEWRLGT